MVVSGENHQWMLELVGESMMRKGISISSQSISPEDTILFLSHK